jgi:hypothetical protein
MLELKRSLLWSPSIYGAGHGTKQVAERVAKVGPSKHDPRVAQPRKDQGNISYVHLYSHYLVGKVGREPTICDWRWVNFHRKSVAEYITGEWNQSFSVSLPAFYRVKSSYLFNLHS